MAGVQRVDQVRSRVTADAQQHEAPRRQLTLFSNESYERVTAVRVAGTRIDIPHMSAADQSTAAHLFGAIPTDKQARVQASFDTLAGLVHSEARSNPSGIQVGSFSAPLTKALGDSLEVYMVSSGVGEADRAVQGVLLGAMVGIEQELSVFARALQAKLDLSAELRTDITELQNEIADWEDPGEKREFSWHEIETDSEGKIANISLKTATLDKAGAEELLNELETGRANLGDLTEMMKLELQQMSQDYQQALNTLSNLLKSQHDSLMSIIRNTKA
jgi:hypothetical protein